eukprot:5020133-Alexandrium_andersonii.AAC.1
MQRCQASGRAQRGMAANPQSSSSAALDTRLRLPSAALGGWGRAIGTFGCVCVGVRRDNKRSRAPTSA